MSKPPAPRRADLTAIELLEETVALLRRTPASAFVAYAAGAVPFWLGLLYFLSDMTQSAFAVERIAGSSLGVALLFLWAKCWQSIYANRLLRVLSGEPGEPWTAARVTRMALVQAAVQPWGLLLKPVALIITLPFGWVSTFFQNATVLGDGSAHRGKGRLLAHTWRWPAQAHALIGILSAFGLFIWLNVALTLAVIPTLLKALLGIETMATRSSDAFVSTTFFVTTIAVTVLCLDPVWKAAYVLRCFYGESLGTGADLTSRLQHLKGRAPVLAATLLFALLSGGMSEPARAAEPAPIVAVDPIALERSIESVLDQREFAWRSPRAEGKPPDGFMASVDRWLKEKKAAITASLRSMRKWLDDHWPWKKKQKAEAETSGDWFSSVPIREIAYVLLVGSIAGLAVALWRGLRTRRPSIVEAQAIATAPDLHAEDVAADQLPEDGWLQLARELIERGDLRLALRAAYLAGLAHLGQRQMLTIARHKSNQDYRRELRRRARSRDELLATFEENLLAFERAWYGRHEVTRDGFERFAQNLERIRATP